MGLPSFIVEASDLLPIYAFNALMKYADDLYLFIGSSNISTATEEFSRTSQWADVNNLRLNPLNTRELIVLKSSYRRVNPPTNSVICGSEHVQYLRVLGVVISSDLRMSFHIDQVPSSFASSLRGHSFMTSTRRGFRLRWTHVDGGQGVKPHVEVHREN